MDTLLLDVAAWDLVQDALGNIAVATEPYSLAQDAASAIKTFLGECYLDTTYGIAYGLILGRNYPLHIVQDFLGHADPRTTRRYDLARESLYRSPAYDLGQLLAAGIAKHVGAFERRA